MLGCRVHATDALTLAPSRVDPPWRARAFGSSDADLEVAFGAPERASAVTALLTACLTDAQGRAVDAEQTWDWTLNQRLQALIAVRLASGTTPLELHADCAHCGEAMALDLDLLVIASAAAPERFTWRREDGIELSLRLPRGRDLQQWTKDGVQSPAAMFASLIDVADARPEALNPDFDAEWLPALEAAFEAHDPLTALRLQTRCPHCEHDNAVSCDLEALLLDGFKRSQLALLDEVLRLARALHWSEAEILHLPAWRRSHYLNRLDARGWA